MRLSSRTEWRASVREALAVRDLLREKKTAKALTHFVEHYEQLTGRATLEWELAGAIAVDDAAIRMPEAFPATLLARPSGAALAFVAAQRTHRASSPPHSLLQGPPIPAAMRAPLARAWASWPRCDALNDPRDRETFARRLATDPRAMEHVLLALVECGDMNLAPTVGRDWLRHAGAVMEASTETLRLLVRHEELVAIGQDAVRMRLARYRGEGRQLLEHAKILFSTDDHRGVIAVSEFAQENRLSSSERHRMLALRLIALDECGESQRVVDEYRDEWMPNGASFPQPERLLYTLHIAGADDSVEHLLRTGTDAGARWVSLWRKRVETQRVTTEDLAEWAEISKANPNAEPILSGLTEAVLAATDSTLAHGALVVAAVKDRWTALASDPTHGPLARAYLVLMERADADIVRTFERHLAGEPPETHAVRRAAAAYVRALSRMREWSRLRAFIQSVPGSSFRGVFGPHEIELHTRMARLEIVPSDDDGSAGDWLTAWERLLALPLDTRHISDVLRHFIDRTAVLRRSGSALLSDEHFEDVHLQVLRRGRAEAERLLASGNLASPVAYDARNRLAASDLAGLRDVIEQLRIETT